MSNSPLATYTNLTSHYTKVTNKKNILIIPHCIVGQWTAKGGADYFVTTDRSASANYIIGKNGDIALGVEECNRAWTSGGTQKDPTTGKDVPIRVNGISGADCDKMGITMEIASDTTHPYAITDAAWEALVKLCVDICQRNGISELMWKGDKSLVGQWDKQNVVVHRWFANKACPGDYIYNRLGELCTRVNAQLKGATATTPTQSTTSSGVPYLVRVKVSNLYIRKGPGVTYATNGFTGKAIFTIVEEKTGPINKHGTKGKWGKLKSGAGWICLSNAYAEKV